LTRVSFKAKRCRAAERAVVRKEKYRDLRGEHGPFHDVFRIYDEKGDRISNLYWSTEISAVRKARSLGYDEVVIRKRR